MFKVGVDWGSSGFRAYRFDPQGKLLEEVISTSGIKFSKTHGFENTLFESIDSWLEPGDCIALSGMITSRNGWIESPYINCPANLSSLISGAKKALCREIEMCFLPGVSQESPADIMRGEEMQLLGVTSEQNEYFAIVPGTHSKWVSVKQQSIQEFRTIATGEIFEVLLTHSLVGALCDNNEWNNAVFLSAAESSFNSHTIVSDLFTARSSVALHQMTTTDAYSHLSGLLIGNEIREGLQFISSVDKPIVLIGAQTLCEKYLSVIEHLGFNATIEPSRAAARGFQKLIHSQSDQL